MPEPIIAVEHVTKQVQDSTGTLTILHDIDFTLAPRQSAAIVGASGSGKSTLLAIIAGLDTPSSGTVKLAGTDLFALDEDARAALRASQLGFVFQSFQLLANLTALENVMLPLELQGRSDARALATEMLERVGLAEQREDGERYIAEPYRERSDTKGRRSERLRVGTVDAFQGKEFDVVLLSMTRSNDIVPDNEQGVRRKWGHLTLENRLCVAMSRQKCLLIVVGDVAMLRSEVAPRHIRGLVEFHALSGGPHGQRI